MLDFTVYKPVRDDAMERMGVTTPEAFASAFAAMIAKETDCEVTGSLVDGYVHLHTDDANMEKVSDSLELRGLTHGF